MAALEWNAGRWTELDMPDSFLEAGRVRVQTPRNERIIQLGAP